MLFSVRLWSWLTNALAFWSGSSGAIEERDRSVALSCCGVLDAAEHRGLGCRRIVRPNISECEQTHAARQLCCAGHISPSRHQSLRETCSCDDERAANAVAPQKTLGGSWGNYSNQCFYNREVVLCSYNTTVINGREPLRARVQRASHAPRPAIVPRPAQHIQAPH